MLTYLSTFLFNHSSLTHVVLLGGSIIAEFAVAIGIILESPKETSWRERLGMVLVLGGVSIGAILTISLFVFDEGISREQQDKIIELETRIAPRRIVPATQEKISELLKPFTGQIFEIFPNPGDNEALHLANDIDAILRKALWAGDPHGASVFGMAAGVTILSTAPAAEVLAKELNNISIETRVTSANSVNGRVQIQVGAKP